MLSTHSDAVPDVPTATDLEAAVARNSILSVFAILAKWQTSPFMLDETGSIAPALTTSALLTAINNARSDIVSLLPAVSCDDRLPIMEAIRAGSVRNFEAFLWNGWDINKPVERDEPSALGYAIHDKDLVKWFLEQGADPNAGSQYDTALSRAVLVGTVEMIGMLLSCGGDVQRGDVLHWAVERKDTACEVVAILLARGAEPNRLRFDGLEPAWSVFGTKEGLGTPLHRAVTLGKIDVVSMLLQHGADPSIQDTLGRTAKKLAEDKGNEACDFHSQCGNSIVACDYIADTNT